MVFTSIPMSQSLLFFLFCLVVDVVNGSTEYLSVCYYPNWSPVKHMAKARLEPDNLPAELCSHLIYAFVVLDKDLNIIPTEPKDLEGNYKKFNDLKSSKTLTMLSVGGQNAKERYFELASVSEENRTKFSNNIITYIRKHNFDGIDIDWEYPKIEYKEYFTLMLKTLWNAINEEAKKEKVSRLILSAAVGVGKDIINKSYQVEEMVKYLDFINVMAYDFHGPWNKITGFKSPLYSREKNPQYRNELSQKWAIEYWISKGAPKNKIVLGMTAAGNTYTLNNTHQHGVGAPVYQGGNPGPYTKKGGFLAYYEICEKLQKEKYAYEWDEIQKVPFAYKGNQWIGFDDYKSIKMKTNWMITQKLAGAMMWSLDLDDFSDMCNTGKFPLTKAMRYTIENAYGKTTKQPTSQPTKRPTPAGATLLQASVWLTATLYIITAFFFYHTQ